METIIRIYDYLKKESEENYIVIKKNMIYIHGNKTFIEKIKKINKENKEIEIVYIVNTKLKESKPIHLELNYVI
jgi:hypothetical protein